MLGIIGFIIFFGFIKSLMKSFVYHAFFVLCGLPLAKLVLIGFILYMVKGILSHAKEIIEVSIKAITKP